jgi:alkylation response protein AidB-like acyl-CoA dehydrogenase
MDLEFSEEQNVLRDMVRGVCAEHCPLETVRALEDDPRGYSEPLFKEFAELGLLGILIPEAFGGAGQSIVEAAILYEELGRAVTPTPHFVSSVLSAGALMAGGSEAQKNEWLPRIAKGDAILTPAWLEPSRGHGPKGVQLRARRDGNDVLLSGTKLHVQFASAATRLVILARTGDELEDVDLFLVDPATRGVTLSQMTSLASDTQYRVDFDEVRIPAETRIGAAGTGWNCWNDGMHDAIILAAAQAAGGARRALDITAEYARERKQFGTPLAAFQSISHYLADALTAIEGGSTLVYEAAWNRAEGNDVSQLAPMAKLFMCGQYRDVTAMCQQVWGGVGFTVEYDIQLYFRRAKQLQLSWWDEAHLKRLISAPLLGGEA